MKPRRRKIALSSILFFAVLGNCASISRPSTTTDFPNTDNECRTLVQQCPSSDQTLEEVESSLEESLAQYRLYNAARGGQPSAGDLVAREIVIRESEMKARFHRKPFLICFHALS